MFSPFLYWLGPRFSRGIKRHCCFIKNCKKGVYSEIFSTFEITKGFDRWLHLVDVELKPFLEKYKLKVHFACANEDQTRVYDLSEIEDPSLLEALMGDEEIVRLRTEAGVNLSSSEVLASVGQHKVW